MLDKKLWEKNMRKAYIIYDGPTQVLLPSINRLVIEASSKCNARCLICQQRKVAETFGEKNLPVDDIRRFITDISEFSERFGGLKMIKFGVYGEPTINPQLPEAVEWARKYSNRCSITTNMSLVDREMAQELLDAGLTNINISIDDCYKEGYERARAGLKWETILKNVLTFRQLRNNGKHNCAITIDIVISEENKNRIGDIVDFFHPMCDGPVVLTYELPVGIVARVQPRHDVTAEPPCVDQIVVKANGDIFPCALDVFHENPLGNLYKDTMSEIYHGEKIEILREGLRTRENIPFCCEICRSLPVFQSEEYRRSKASDIERLLYRYSPLRRFNEYIERILAPEWMKKAKIC